MSPESGGLVRAGDGSIAMKETLVGPSPRPRNGVIFFLYRFDHESGSSVRIGHSLHGRVIYRVLDNSNAVVDSSHEHVVADAVTAEWLVCGRQYLQWPTQGINYREIVERYGWWRSFFGHENSDEYCMMQLAVT
jgi:hypothetical protein